MGGEGGGGGRNGGGETWVRNGGRGLDMGEKWGGGVRHGCSSLANTLFPHVTPLIFPYISPTLLFLKRSGVPRPPSVRRVQFEALVLAEGERSPTCKSLGVTKTVDRFATAIGLVVNLQREGPAGGGSTGGGSTGGGSTGGGSTGGGSTREPRSFVSDALGEKVRALTARGITCENLEFLVGETYYVAATVRKATLLKRGVLRKELGGGSLLEVANVNLEPLLELGRVLASVCGVPETVTRTSPPTPLLRPPNAPLTPLLPPPNPLLTPF